MQWNSRCHLVSRSPAWSGLVRDCALTAQHILLGRMLQFLCFRRNRLNFNTSIYTCLKCLTCSVFVSSLSVHGDEILRVNAMLLIFFFCNLTEILSKSHLKKIKKKKTLKYLTFPLNNIAAQNNTLIKSHNIYVSPCPTYWLTDWNSPAECHNCQALHMDCWFIWQTQHPEYPGASPATVQMLVQGNTPRSQ